MENNKIIIYQTEDGQTQIDVRVENETVWLTQAQMAELFLKDQSVVARHINNAFKEGELEEKSNMQILHNTQYKYRPTKVYSLDVIISVGYRVKSQRGTAFRYLGKKCFERLFVEGLSHRLLRCSCSTKNCHKQEHQQCDGDYRQYAPETSPITLAVRQLIRQQGDYQSDEWCQKHRKEERPAESDAASGANKSNQCRQKRV